MKINKTFILITLIVLSCNSGKDDPYYPTTMGPNSTTNENGISIKNDTIEMNYLALGDSYTIGESVNEDERWSVQLVELLNGSGNKYNTPKIIAATGWTTAQLNAAIEHENIQQEYDLVTLLIGVNNQYRGGSLEIFRKEFIELLNKAIYFGHNNPDNVLVVSIPDWGVTPYAKNFDREKITREINLFNAVKKEETLKRKVRFIDITDISRRALNQEIYIASDGLHFSGKMYRLWASEIINNY